MVYRIRIAILKDGERIDEVGVRLAEGKAPCVSDIWAVADHMAGRLEPGWDNRLSQVSWMPKCRCPIARDDIEATPA